MATDIVENASSQRSRFASRLLFPRILEQQQLVSVFAGHYPLLFGWVILAWVE